MATTITPPAPATLADVVERLGSIPLERIPARPAPGTATEADVLARPVGEKRLYELVDGVLVEKPMGFYESRLAVVLSRLLEEFLDRHDEGTVVGADATMRLEPGLVRLPDVSFISWERLPNRELPREPVPDLAPDLAVEVLSEGNTPAEMERKLREYFAAGTRLVWYLDPASRTATVYSSPESSVVLTEEDTLEGGDVLPGFRLPVREWFERAGQRRSG
jgi:Uma2 family endonuclease